MNSKWIPSSPNLRGRSLGQHGFTLIEVMISMLIFAFIVMLTSKSVIEAAKLKAKLSEGTEFSSSLRTSIGFMERDLNQVFNPRWFLAADLERLDPNKQPLPVQAGAPAKATPTPPMTLAELNKRLNNTAFQAFEYWSQVLDYTGIRASRFKGDETHMSFVTSDHIRVYKQKKESIYVKVKYELVKDTLYKTIHTHAFDLEEKDDSPDRVTYVILTNVKKLKFQYFKGISHIFLFF